MNTSVVITNFAGMREDGGRTFIIALGLSILIHGVMCVFLPLLRSPANAIPMTEVKIRLTKANQTPSLNSIHEEKSKSVPTMPLALDSGLPQKTSIASVPSEIDSNMPLVRGSALGSQPVSAIGATSGSLAQNGPTVSHQTVEDLSGVIEAFVRRLEERKEYPYIARKRGQTGTVTVRISITKNGVLNEATIVSSSGVSRLDEAALALVSAACPFNHGTGRDLRITVPITYDLKEK